MPLPVIAGLPWLAAVIGAAFAAIFSWLVKFFTKRVAVTLAIVALVVSATAAFVALITGLVSSLEYVLPPWFSLAVQMVVPENTTTCFSVIITARLARWAYEWNVRIIQYKLF
ncbi:MAG: minor coat protein [Saccharospirillaceae bacterium]|nr:minor coat protein [Saccharospirillaceae bacterium]MCD8531195.1 minor coat protein [Saccharospirillaceae bacterium]